MLFWFNENVSRLLWISFGWALLFVDDFNKPLIKLDIAWIYAFILIVITGLFLTFCVILRED